MFIEDWQGIDGLVAAFGERSVPAPPRAVVVTQVHGRDVVACDDMEPGVHPDTRADALVATRAGVLVAVKTADCVPILLVAGGDGSPNRWAAAVHAGWRGAAAGVIAAAVADAVRRGDAARSLRAAIGPAIGPCCYEVGEEVAASFRRLDLPVDEHGAKPHLDLPGIARVLLLRAGVASERVALCAPCTRCNPDRFHSYRRSGPQAGRQLSWIGWR